MPDVNGKPLASDPNTPNPLLSNTAYDVIKDIVQLAFPAFVTAYAGLGALWNWPDTDRWVTTAGVIGVLLGALLKIAQKRYEKLPVKTDGVVVIDGSQSEALGNVALEEGWDSAGDTVTLKVVDVAQENSL